MKPKEREDEIILEDSEDYRQSEAGSYKEIVLRQFSRCCNEGSKEMTTGGTATRYINGIVMQLSLPNQKEIFCNSVNMLKTMLNSQVQGNEDIKPQVKKIEDEIKESKSKNNSSFDNELKQLQEIMLKSKDESKTEICRIRYNEIVKKIKAEAERLEFEKNQALLIILEQLLSELNYFEEGSAIG